MYKAIKAIGGYKVGDTVPDGKAKTWLKMYETAHVELVKDVKAKVAKVAVPKEVIKSKEKPKSSRWGSKK